MDKRTEKIYAMQDCITEVLGNYHALQAIIKAMSEDEKEDIFSYIIRCYDLPLDEYLIKDGEEV